MEQRISMKKKEKYIKLDAEKKRQIAKEFRVSLPTVCAALNYETNSAKAITLRAAAINRGGKVFVEENQSNSNEITKSNPK